MAGGIPSPEFFPFETLSAEMLAVDSVPLDQPRVPKKPSLLSWLWQKSTTSFTIPKYVDHATPTTIQLATSLQYQAATGPPALPLFLREYVEKIYRPAYSDWDVLLNCGATDAWGKIVFMLMERGDACLVEEWTYPGAENSFIPLEVEMVPIKMDGQGVLPSHLEHVLSTWDEKKRGKKRPRVFYTIPTGQNPTGATMLGDRKKEIYDICVKYGTQGSKSCSSQMSSFAKTSLTTACTLARGSPNPTRLVCRKLQSASWTRRRRRGKRDRKRLSSLCPRRI